tara:strand:+ start:9239 stop:10033 length:795 start_codon:yes stop_codon:yes gene_type:complete
MELNTATIIPLHKEKFKYAIEALISFHKHSSNENLYFIFSNIKEYKYFCSLTDLSYKYLIVPSNMDLSINPINKKKFYGLDYLFSKGFNLVGVLDCEVLFVNSFNSKKLYKNIFNRSYFKSNQSTKGSSIIKYIATKLNVANNPHLISQTNNYTQYWWFNEICVYEKDLFLEFSKWVFSLNNFKDIISDPICFDYLLYSIWLIVFKNYNLKLIDPLNTYEFGALEHNFLSKETSLKFNSYIDAYSLPDIPHHIIIQIHSDRTHE